MHECNRASKREGTRINGRSVSCRATLGEEKARVGILKHLKERLSDSYSSG